MIDKDTVARVIGGSYHYFDINTTVLVEGYGSDEPGEEGYIGYRCKPLETTRCHANRQWVLEKDLEVIEP